MKAAQKERDEWTRKMNDLELQQHRRRVHLAEEKAKADADMLRQKFDAALVQAPKKRCFQPLGKSGISKRGGKPVTNGFGTHPAPKSFEGARIPQMTPAELKKAEKSLGVVDEPTANPHIVRVDVDALERMSGAVEAEAEGLWSPRR